MMTEKSDTPRTDAETWKPFDTEAGCDMDCEVVDACFARQLERELNTALQSLERAEYEWGVWRARALDEIEP